MDNISIFGIWSLYIYIWLFYFRGYRVYNWLWVWYLAFHPYRMPLPVVPSKTSCNAACRALVKMHKTELVKNCHAFTLQRAAICLYFGHFRQAFDVVPRCDFGCAFVFVNSCRYRKFVCFFPSVRRFQSEDCRNTVFL